MRNRLISVAVSAIVLLVINVQAANTFVIKNGVTNWNSAASYSDGPGGVPSKDDIVQIPSGASVWVLSSDRASCDIVSALDNIQPLASNSSITFDVAEGDTLTITSTIWRASSGGGRGYLNKEGKGTLVLDSNGEKYQGSSYYTSMLNIYDGTLVAPQNFSYMMNGVQTFWHALFGQVNVASNAVFKLPYGVRANKDKHVQFLKLSGSGTIVSDYANTELRLGYGFNSLSEYEPCVFSGVLDSKVYLFTTRTILLTGTNSTMSSGILVYGGNGNWGETNAVVGIQKFGNKADTASSAGVCSYLRFDANGGVFRYLGTGEETDKDFFCQYKIEDHRLCVLDGGTNGGLVVAGKIYTGAKSDSWRYIRFGLCGDGPVANVIKGPVQSWNTAAGSCFTFEKRGKGIWRFADCNASDGNLSRQMHGSFIVADGTLQFDSLLKRGEYCALGTATNFFLPWSAAMGQEKKEDWAFRLGATNVAGIVASASGTLEYTGTNAMSAATRPLKMLGNGGLANSTSYRTRYLALPPEDNGAKMLTLDGSSTAENEILDVTDTVGSPVSVVKEGSGTWLLGGNQTFHGDLTVNGGTLVVCKRPSAYTWFRFTLKNTFMLEGSLAKTGAAVRFLGLYDADGRLQSTNIVASAGESAASLEPGQVGYDTARRRARGSVASNPLNVDATNMFNSGTAIYTDVRLYSVDGSAALVPTNTNPQSWIPVVVRLPDGANEITSFDWSTVYGYTSGNKAGFSWTPDQYSLEGSVDGVHWENVNAAGGDFVVNTNDYPGLQLDAGFVYSGGKHGRSNLSIDNAKLHSGGCAIRGTSTNTFDVLNNAGTVRVAPGATLRAAGEGIAAIRSVAADASVSGTGTIEGFSFASDGSLEVANLSGNGEHVLPLECVDCTGFENVQGWTLDIDGIGARGRRARVRNGRLCIVPKGISLSFK